MQSQGVRHDGLERMIRAYQFFVAFARRFRKPAFLNHGSVTLASGTKS